MKLIFLATILMILIKIEFDVTPDSYMNINFYVVWFLKPCSFNKTKQLQGFNS